MRPRFASYSPIRWSALALTMIILVAWLAASFRRSALTITPGPTPRVQFILANGCIEFTWPTPPNPAVSGLACTISSEFSAEFDPGLHLPRRNAVFTGHQFQILPLWIPSAVALISTTLLWLRPRRRPAKGHCPTCSYDLTGNESGKCPECGTPLTQDPAHANAPGGPTESNRAEGFKEPR